MDTVVVDTLSAWLQADSELSSAVASGYEPLLRALF